MFVRYRDVRAGGRFLLPGYGGSRGETASGRNNTGRQWIYKPYLLNGEPVEVDTQLTVNFSFSRP
jgi:hypothetical protein